MSCRRWTLADRQSLRAAYVISAMRLREWHQAFRVYLRIRKLYRVNAGHCLKTLRAKHPHMSLPSLTLIACHHSLLRVAEDIATATNALLEKQRLDNYRDTFGHG